MVLLAVLVHLAITTVALGAGALGAFLALYAKDEEAALWLLVVAAVVGTLLGLGAVAVIHRSRRWLYAHPTGIWVSLALLALGAFSIVGTMLPG